MATMLYAEQTDQGSRAPREIEVPASTAWPLVLAFGFTLLFAGLVTSVSVSILGAVLSVAGCVGWFREVFPHQREEAVPVAREDLQVTTARRVVERVPVAAEQLRAWLPVHTYPISAGVGLCRITATRTCTAECVSRGCFCDCFSSTRTRVHACGSALWRHAAYVRAPAHRARRTDRSRVVVGDAVLEPWTSESFTGKPYRLGLVHRFADGLRHRRRYRRRTAVAYADTREPVLRSARWN